jgi:hypothetical protein
MRWNLDIEDQVSILELNMTNGTASHHLFPSISVTRTALMVGHLRTALSGRGRVIWVERQAWNSLPDLELFILRVQVGLGAMKTALIRLGRPSIPVSVGVGVVVFDDVLVLLVRRGVCDLIIVGVIVILGSGWIIRDRSRLVIVRIVLAMSHLDRNQKREMRE